jgi:hypothetical protein
MPPSWIWSFSGCPNKGVPNHPFQMNIMCISCTRSPWLGSADFRIHFILPPKTKLRFCPPTQTLFWPIHWGPLFGTIQNTKLYLLASLASHCASLQFAPDCRETQCKHPQAQNLHESYLLAGSQYSRISLSGTSRLHPNGQGLGFRVEGRVPFPFEQSRLEQIPLKHRDLYGDRVKTAKQVSR